MSLISEKEIELLDDLASSVANDIVTFDEIDCLSSCYCSGDCGQSCSGGCEAGCSGSCGRSCSGGAY